MLQGTESESPHVSDVEGKETILYSDTSITVTPQRVIIAGRDHFVENMALATVVMKHGTAVWIGVGALVAGAAGIVMLFSLTETGGGPLCLFWPAMLAIFGFLSIAMGAGQWSVSVQTIHGSRRSLLSGPKAHKCKQCAMLSIRQWPCGVGSAEKPTSSY
jgi:hypothetical protein